MASINAIKFKIYYCELVYMFYYKCYFLSKILFYNFLSKLKSRVSHKKIKSRDLPMSNNFDIGALNFFSVFIHQVFFLLVALLLHQRLFIHNSGSSIVNF